MGSRRTRTPRAVRYAPGSSEDEARYTASTVSCFGRTPQGPRIQVVRPRAMALAADLRPSGDGASSSGLDFRVPPRCALAREPAEDELAGRMVRAPDCLYGGGAVVVVEPGRHMRQENSGSI